jgi:hypothetical protein
MATQIQLRRGTAAEWTTADPILAEGEMGIELDTRNFKIGNGVDNWTDLTYGFSSLPGGGDEGQILAKDSDDSFDFVWIDNATDSIKFIVQNNTGSTIAKAVPVMVTGAIGSGRMTVAPAVADGSVEPKFMIGVTNTAITDDNSGEVVVFGPVKKIDTTAYTVGTVLFIDPATPGGWTTTRPTSPNIDMPIGIVTRSSSSNGEIFIRMWSQSVGLNELEDVTLNGLTTGDVLTYDGTKWGAAAPTVYSTVEELDDLTDVDLTTPPTDGQVLTYDEDSEQWVATDLPTDVVGATELDELTDVDLTVAPEDGQVLTYDNTAGKWVATDLPTDIVGATELDELTDVDLTVAPTENDVLTYDGTSWVAAAPTGGGGGGSLPTITTATKTTASLAIGAHELTTITMQQGYRVYKLETDVPARIRLYTTTTGRDADETRELGNVVSESIGLIMEATTEDGLLAYDLGIAVDGYVASGTAIPITITNLSDSTQEVTLTLTYVRTI